MKLNVKSLAEVEIGFLVVAPGIYHARIEKVEVKPNKAGTGNNLSVMFKVLDPTVTLNKDGSTQANKGNVIVSRYYSLVPTDNYDPDKNLKELAVAIKLAPEKDLNVEDLLLKIVNIKVTHKHAEGTYQEGNDVARVTPIKDDDMFTPPPF